MQKPSSFLGYWLTALALAAVGCDNDPPMMGLPPVMGAPTAGTTTGTGTSGVPASTGTSGTSSPAGMTAATAGASGGTTGTGTATAGMGAGSSAGTMATAGAGVAGTTDSGGTGGPAAGASGSSGMTGNVDPLVRNSKYSSLAPALGEPLPMAAPGTWTWAAIDGALSRDGSPAGFYYKFSKTGSKNLLVYLVGGGVCADGFFCNMNPANKDQSLTAENVLVGVGNLIGPDPEPQDPNGLRWQSGIFKDDPMNPARDWNMIFIPYVTGDVYFGSKPNGTVPNVPGTFQFVGKLNMMKFIARIVPTFPETEIAVLAGSSAGGIGALLNAPYLADALIDLGKGARFYVLNDAGPFFHDPYLEVCIQKRYRDLYALDQSFPEDCTACRSADGGGLVKGWLQYLADRYPTGTLGGFVDSDQDEIMKFFFSEGLDNCAFIENPVVGLLAYPADRYPAALKNMLNELVDPSRMATYIWSGTLHQNLFQTATADRFYMTNGLNKTVAEWFGNLISGKPERIGVIQ